MVMKKNVKGKSTTKRTIKAKSTVRSGATAGTFGFELKIPAAVGKKLSAIAENDSNFKGSNPERYAKYLIKSLVEKTPAAKA